MAKPEKRCSVDDCDKPHDSKGYCTSHYSRWRKYGNPLEVRRIPNRKCSIEGCQEKYRKNGMCSFHYNRSDLFKSRKDRYYRSSRALDVRAAYEETVSCRFSRFRCQARQREITVVLTEGQYALAVKPACYYCGERTSRRGLDRLDSLRGYSLDNVVACCSTCNYMKHELGQYEFFEHIAKILRHHLDIRSMCSACGRGGEN